MTITNMTIIAMLMVAVLVAILVVVVVEVVAVVVVVVVVVVVLTVVVVAVAKTNGNTDSNKNDITAATKNDNTGAQQNVIKTDKASTKTIERNELAGGAVASDWTATCICAPSAGCECRWGNDSGAVSRDANHTHRLVQPASGGPRFPTKT